MLCQCFPSIHVDPPTDLDRLANTLSTLILHSRNSLPNIDTAQCSPAYMPRSHIGSSFGQIKPCVPHCSGRSLTRSPSLVPTEEKVFIYFHVRPFHFVEKLSTTYMWMHRILEFKCIPLCLYFCVSTSKHGHGLQKTFNFSFKPFECKIIKKKPNIYLFDYLCAFVCMSSIISMAIKRKLWPSFK